ncbi:MAG: YicC family protein [Lachnospiraceae bacterium]|nr:YicC family protein [Lachnospiraceae bacterium]
MVRSMTGFGRFELNENGRKLSVEMKSVNHRYCEIGVRLPKKLNFFETAIRNIVKQYASRGKIDMYLYYDEESDSTESVRYNRGIAEEYIRYMKQMAEEFGLSSDISVTSLARMQDVLVAEEAEPDEETLMPFVEKAVRGACERFVVTREAEGAELRKDVEDKLDAILTGVDEIVKRSPEIVSNYRAKLLAKVQEVMGDTQVDPQALATELVTFADRICTDEETVRLRAHCKNMRDTLDAKENVGRKLDFIAQEMNREANTILSKANDLTVSDIAINLKTDIEKIREQIQNIE